MMRRLAAAMALALLGGAELAGEQLLDYVTQKPVRYAGKFSSAAVDLPPYRPHKREFRGVWVATVENLDFPIHRTAAEFKRDYVKLIDNIAKARFNAVIFQIRPTCDAFYPSRVNSWSQNLAGTDGVGIRDFDPLRFMVDEAHKRGLEFHAWFNPYRVIGNTKLSKSAYLKTLSPKNFARRNPKLVLSVRQPDGGNLLILNPGEPAVMNHIVETVREVANNYQIDAVHFDDYFYPYSGFADQDAATYAAYLRSGGKKTVDDWRRGNVTSVIVAIRRGLNEHNRGPGRKIRFGVSPFGIWGNRSVLREGSLTGGLQSYFVQHADTRSWVKKGYIDYIVPQLYWPFSHDSAAYAALADWWSDTVRGTGTKLFIGHAVSRLGATRQWSAPELANQLRYNCGRKEISGSVFFSYRHVFFPANRVQRSGVDLVLKNYWKKRAVMPW